ncbi:hypothetical protein BC941DRAFT_501805 [Chlamydoabsidia padenii]|nr:hypothetical protein BC941DRAFT_501805 [Chlamydoabsidia padenii]
MSDDITQTKRIIDQVEPIDNNETQTKRPRKGPGMFGVLVGTLNKIHSNNETDQPKIRQRQALDAKLQARLEQEKQEMKDLAEQKEQERNQARAQRQAELDKQRPVKIAAIQRQRANFFLTKTITPALAYLPKQLLPEQQEQLDAQLKEANDVYTAAKESANSV